MQARAFNVSVHPTPDQAELRLFPRWSSPSLFFSTTAIFLYQKWKSCFSVAPE